MGEIRLKCKVINIENPDKSILVDFVVDSGATYTLLSKEMVDALELKPYKQKQVELADGSINEFQVAACWIEYKGEKLVSNVFVGNSDINSLLGQHELQGFELSLDFKTHTIKSSGKLHL